MFIFLLFLASNTALSAPIFEPHAQETTHWVSAPTTRGTFGLLLSCVLTLFLCLWSSLHPNVPHKDETPVRRSTLKLMYTLLALLAPELIVYTAWCEHSSATTLVKEVNEALEVCPSPYR